MYYKKYFEILDFHFWSGARDRIESATDEQIEQVAQRIEDVFGNGEEIPTDEEINDLVWFKCDDIFFPEEEDEDKENEDEEEEENDDE